VLLPALLLGGALDWAGMHWFGAATLYSGRSGMWDLTVDVSSTLTWHSLAGNILFLQTIHLPDGFVIPVFGSNSPLWSLSNEFWYYIAFPLLVLMIAAARPAWQRALFALALVLWAWLFASSIALLSIPWLMGAPIGYLPPFPASGKWARRLALGAGVILLALALSIGKLRPTGFVDYVIGFAVALLIWITLHCATGDLPGWYVRLSRRASHSSYTLYVVHFPMLIFLKAAFHLPRLAPGWHTLLVPCVVMAVILIYAQLVYQCFERNTDRVRAWFKPAKGEPVAA
jgi:peptidoglycan/LPS O-acetylase OafA/YrhL